MNKDTLELSPGFVEAVKLLRKKLPSLLNGIWVASKKNVAIERFNKYINLTKEDE